jgi:uncharacterized membrane protein YdjX (TVP38/TMEM64 family)
MAVDLGAVAGAEVLDEDLTALDGDAAVLAGGAVLVGELKVELVVAADDDRRAGEVSLLRGPTVAFNREMQHHVISAQDIRGVQRPVRPIAAQIRPARRCAAVRMRSRASSSTSARACYGRGVSAPPQQRPPRRAKIAAVVAVVAVLVVAYQLGVFQQFADPARMKLALVELGPWGYLVFVAAYAALQPFGVPGTDEALGQRAFVTVFLLRLVFWMPPPLHAFFGVSKVGFATHFWGSLAGYALPLLLVSLFGERMLEVMMAAPVELWVGLGVGATASGLGLWALQRRRRR